MAAAAPKKTKAGPLPQLYKEAAWAIKWVAPGLYNTLTAREGGQEAKEEMLIAFFRGQGTEQDVVLDESGKLNADGEGILQELLRMSNAAPVPRPAAVPRPVGGGSGKTVPRAANKENQEGLAQKFAFMLVSFKDDGAAVAKVKEVIKEETGASYGTLTPKSFNDMKPDIYSDDESQFPDLPSFDLQEKLYKKLAPTKNYTDAIFDTLQALPLGGREEVFQGLTGAPRKFKDIPRDERSQFNIDDVAQSAITAYRLAHEDELLD